MMQKKRICVLKECKSLINLFFRNFYRLRSHAKPSSNNKTEPLKTTRKSTSALDASTSALDTKASFKRQSLSRSAKKISPYKDHFNYKTKLLFQTKSEK